MSMLVGYAINIILKKASTVDNKNCAHLKHILSLISLILKYYILYIHIYII